MDELYIDSSESERDSMYPVVATMHPDGVINLEIPGFPSVSYTGPDMPSGIQYIKEALHEELLTAIVPPIIPNPAQITLLPNQVLMQVQV